MLTKQQGLFLLRLARATLAKRLGIADADSGQVEGNDDPALLATSGVFVTLHRKGALRGCIGSLQPEESVIAGIRRNAVNAAFHDHRFDPLRAEELAEVEIEVSILSTPEVLAYHSADELSRLLVPGKDGVILRAPGGAGATFLPQVWQQLSRPEQFLGQLCRKAGLAEDAWRSGRLEVLTYRVQSFSEHQFETESGR